jgi:hypothetical protein
MIIASVRFRLRPDTTLEEIAAAFEAGTQKYRNAPGLITKHYLYGNGQGGGIYVWQSRELAEQFYTPEWKAKITERYGAAPEIEWLDNPVTVDNVNGRVIVDERKSRGSGTPSNEDVRVANEVKPPPRSPFGQASGASSYDGMTAARLQRGAVIKT